MPALGSHALMAKLQRDAKTSIKEMRDAIDDKKLRSQLQDQLKSLDHKQLDALKGDPLKRKLPSRLDSASSKASMGRVSQSSAAQ